MDTRNWRRPGMRSALLLGLGLTFGIWLFAGNFFLSRVGETERQTAAVNSRYTQAQELLSNIRGQVLLASIFVRDALLDPNPQATDYLGQVEKAHETVSRALDQYEPVLDSQAERERLERLRWQLEDFRKTMRQVLGTDSSRWQTDARVLLRTHVVPKRDMVMRVSDEVQALNRAAFIKHQREIGRIYGASQRHLWQTLGVALVASFGIALVVAIYASRLESRLQRQHEREAAYARELQDLSAKLITAQEEERRSIARELHDEIGQALTAIKVELAVAERTIDAGGDTTALQDARSITEGALTTVRDLSHLLHPTSLDDLGLQAAVEWYVRGFSRRYDIRVDLTHVGMEERLAAEIEVTAYRVIQEALTNVAKHAGATVCSVTLQRVNDTVRIVVKDNGVGFDPVATRSIDRRPGLGLIGMRERAVRFDGSLQIESAPGKGTTVTIDFAARGRTPAEANRADPARPSFEHPQPVVIDG